MIICTVDGLVRGSAMQAQIAGLIAPDSTRLALERPKIWECYPVAAPAIREPLPKPNALGVKKIGRDKRKENRAKNKAARKARRRMRGKA